MISHESTILIQHGAALRLLLGLTSCACLPRSKVNTSDVPVTIEEVGQPLIASRQATNDEQAMLNEIGQ